MWKHNATILVLWKTELSFMCTIPVLGHLQTAGSMMKVISPMHHAQSTTNVLTINSVFPVIMKGITKWIMATAVIPMQWLAQLLTVHLARTSDKEAENGQWNRLNTTHIVFSLL